MIKFSLTVRRVCFLALLTFLITGIPTQAQKEGAVWYFGSNAGLDFNRFYPTPLTKGALSTREGVASICDKNGNLLFYTDGQTIYNSNHEIMKEGLMGDPTSTQSSIVVPMPGVTPVKKYYIFTVDDVGSANDPGNGLRYTVVDMSLNFGKGAVTADFNKELMPAGDRTIFTEKITAVKNKDTLNPCYWIIAHEFNTNNFLVFKLDKNGVTRTNPLRRPVGMVHENADSGEQTNWGATGYLKSSPKGDLLAVAVEAQKAFELFKFNNETSDIELVGKLPAGETQNTITPLWNAYGVEFSPTSNYLYGSARKGGIIYRWDISDLTQGIEPIKQSVTILRENKSSLIGALQLAINGKIYVSIHGKPYLGVINAPIQAECDYSESPGASLYDNDLQEGGTAGYGLPTFLPDFFKAAEFYCENKCFNDTTRFYLSTINIVNLPKWTIFDKDNNKVGNATIDPKTYDGSFVFPAPGEYVVWLQVKQIGMGDVEQKQVVTIHELPNTLLVDISYLCKGGHVTLDAGYGAFYNWTDNPNLSVVRYRDIYEPGKFTVTVTHYNGCSRVDSTEVVERPLPEIDSLVVQKATCGTPNGSIEILMDTDPSDYEFTWTDTLLQENHTHIATGLKGGVYEVTITSIETGCFLNKKIIVSEEGAPVVEVTSSAKAPVCPGTPVKLTASGPDFFLWDPPVDVKDRTNSEITVIPQQTTTYVVMGYALDNNGKPCSAYGEITVEVYTVIPPDLGSDLWEACDGETITLNGGNYASWSWSNGMTSREINLITSVDTLILNVTDQHGCPSGDTTHVRIKPLPVVDLIDDGIFCSGTEVRLDGGEDADSWLWYPSGDTTRFYQVTATNNYYVVATKEGCQNSDTAYIQVNSRDSLKIKGIAVNHITCNGASNGSIVIDAKGEGMSYEYSIDDGLTYFDNNGAFENLDGATPYYIRVKEDDVCVVRLDSVIEIHEPDPISIEYTLISPSCDPCTDGEITLILSGGTPPYTVLWSTMDSTLKLRHIGMGTYPVWVKDSMKCGAYQNIEMEPGHGTFSIPNAFSPDGNNINETWEIGVLKDKPNYLIQVFSRAGHKVFESSADKPFWDGIDMNTGDPAPVGTYFYLIYVDVTTKIKPLKGTVTILR